MGNYSYSDLSHAFDYAQKNPKKSLTNWINEYSRILTDDDIKYYNNNLEYFEIPFTINGNKEILLLFKSNSMDVIDTFINKYVGNKTYYQFNVGDNYNFNYSIISFRKELFGLKNWKIHDKYNWVNIINSDIDGIWMMFDGNIEDDVDETTIESFSHYKHKLEIMYKYFWNSAAEIFFEDIYNLDFKPYNELFK